MKKKAEGPYKKKSKKVKSKKEQEGKKVHFD
jgi:hypothetical protein